MTRQSSHGRRSSRLRRSGHSGSASEQEAPPSHAWRPGASPLSCLFDLPWSPDASRAPASQSRRVATSPPAHPGSPAWPWAAAGARSPRAPQHPRGPGALGRTEPCAVDTSPAHSAAANPGILLASARGLVRPPDADRDGDTRRRSHARHPPPAGPPHQSSRRPSRPRRHAAARRSVPRSVQSRQVPDPVQVLARRPWVDPPSSVGHHARHRTDERALGRSRGIPRLHVVETGPVRVAGAERGQVRGQRDLLHGRAGHDPGGRRAGTVVDWLPAWDVVIADDVDREDVPGAHQDIRALISPAVQRISPLRPPRNLRVLVAHPG